MVYGVFSDDVAVVALGRLMVLTTLDTTLRFRHVTAVRTGGSPACLSFSRFVQQQQLRPSACIHARLIIIILILIAIIISRTKLSRA